MRKAPYLSARPAKLDTAVDTQCISKVECSELTRHAQDDSRVRSPSCSAQDQASTERDAELVAAVRSRSKKPRSSLPFASASMNTFADCGETSLRTLCIADFSKESVSLVSGAVTSLLPHHQAEFASSILVLASRSHTTRGVAQLLSTPCRTLIHRANRLGLRAPKQIIGLAVAALLCTLNREKPRTIGNCARRLGFASGADLREFLKARTGKTPSEWCRLGDHGIEIAIAELQRPKEVERSSSSSAAHSDFLLARFGLHADGAMMRGFSRTPCSLIHSTRGEQR
jgi:AraC-like DNA-binding protein